MGLAELSGGRDLWWEEQDSTCSSTVNLNCQLEEIETHLGHGLLGVPVGTILIRSTEGRRPVHSGRHHSLTGSLDCISGARGIHHSLSPPNCGRNGSGYFRLLTPRVPHHKAL